MPHLKADDSAGEERDGAASARGGSAMGEKKEREM
jgi:hypothetical protein